MASSLRPDACATAMTDSPELFSLPVERGEESKGFSKRQWIFASVFGAAHFASAACISLQAPFYPEKAESKGVTPTEYGLVFGVFELTSFISSPLFGKLLDMVERTQDFLILSFAVRIVEALGAAASVTASFTIIATEFPETVATTFATLETFFGLGLIAGPTIGGILYQIGGYKTPFMVMGGVLITAAFITFLILPDVDHREDGEKGNRRVEGNHGGEGSRENAKDGIFSALIIPFFALSPTAVGGVFVVSGGMYVISAPLIGRLCDKRMIPAVVAICVGHAMISISFFVIGPAPFLPNIPTILWLSICGLAVHGFGVGLILVPGFVDGMTKAILGGLPEGVTTYAILSGLWASSFALGAFIGPSIGGVLFEILGFRTGSLAVVAIHIILEPQGKEIFQTCN
ncbi:hypothetical protein J437_LFUL004477 [Ladona fulva]|uniref:Major facilitator superfamily (MFS) profile domain-containing protein n=1 Tax=Ladona fulva TaxID=123851 RepID=A0A8K0K071_LADFU|nr:hypothetical protein J437_LFUL004477 [Ladona fulva]